VVSQLSFNAGGTTYVVMTTASCKVCAGTGWVCESHPDQPMDHDGCGGAGMPCRACNTGHPPDVDGVMDQIDVVHDDLKH
jgi:hypothetical protein